MSGIHTHRGTCQACGGKQAVDNDSHWVAKHGYQVAGFGYFNGICSGADKVPAELGTDHTKVIIQSLTEYAVNQEAFAADLKSGAKVLVVYHESRWNRVTGKSDLIELKFADADQWQQKSVLDRTIYGLKSQADQARSHIKMLIEFVLTRLGQPQYPVSDVKPVKPVEAKVNVYTGAIEGTFRTKAAQKAVLEQISHEFDKLTSVVRDAHLAISRDQRSKAGDELYFSLPHYPHEFRAKHATQILEQFPHMVLVVAELNRLVALRNKVRSRQVSKV